MHTLFRISILAMIALNLAGTIFGIKPELPVFVVSLTALVTGFPLMGKTFRNAAIIFLTLGAILLAVAKSPFEVWMTATGSMTSIVAIVSMMQTFAVPISLGGYDTAMRSWMEGKFRKPASLFFFATFSTHILTSFLNLGSIPILVSLLGPSVKDRIQDWKRFFARATTRGYVLSALWSPGAVNLSLVVQATGLTWSQVFVPGAVLAILGMGLSLITELTRNETGPAVPQPSKAVFHTEAGGSTPASDSEDSRSKPASGLALPGHPTAVGAARDRSRIVDPEADMQRRGKRKIQTILAVAAVFVLVAAILEWLRIGTASGRTVLAGLIVVSGWTATLARKPGLREALEVQWTTGMLKVGDISPFFVAMGIFSTGLEESGFLEMAGPLLKSAASFLGPGTVVLVAGLIVATSLIGLHPFITIVLFGKILAYTALPIPPITVALSLALGGASAYMITPFAGIIMTISKLLDTKASDVALRWNWRFSLSFFAMGILFAFAWGLIT